VPFAYIDFEALQPGVPSQQERADADGHWAVYEAPPAQYQITASAPGRGIAVTAIAAPRTDVALQLSGTGRIAGTVSGLGTGTFDLGFESCDDAHDPSGRAMAIAHEPRLVEVTGGRFEVDDAPACGLVLIARWRGQFVRAHVPVVAGQTAHVDLDLGPPRAKQVRGTVRDRGGHAVAHARVTAVADGRTTSTTTDGDGHYSIDTFGGAQLAAGDGDHVTAAVATRANVPVEQIDLRLQ
jgi:hypothetical protein